MCIFFVYRLLPLGFVGVLTVYQVSHKLYSLHQRENITMVKCVTRIAIVFAILTLMLVTLALPVLAAFYQGTPSPSLSPVFGTLVNFDDKPSNTVIAWDDYVSVGVASITETQGPWPLMRLSGSQSMPNYVGTGDAYGWDGTILIEFTNLANKVGIGIADSAAGPEVLNIYDSGHNLLESQTAPSGGNVYAYFERSSFDIKYFEIVGDFFAVDDLQFCSTPPPPIVGVGGEVFPVNKFGILTPLIAFGAAIIAGASILCRRRRAQG
jgi:hypothetical protein